MAAGKFWNVSATNTRTLERWVHNGTREECEHLLAGKLKEWGKAKANVEWSEHEYSPA
jgi:hypothetical protein